MPDFTMPLGGNVTQSILPWTWTGNTFGLFNVYLGESSNPAVERDVLDVASYGKQLGRIEDALMILVKRVLPEDMPPGADKDAIDDLKAMVRDIGKAKKLHGS